MEYSGPGIASSQICGQARFAVADSRSVPLTFQQEWALNHWMHEENLYVIEISFRIRGPLNVGALRSSLSSMVQRHDALRIRLVSVCGKLEQRVDRKIACPLHIVDLADRSGGDNEDKAQALVAEIVRKRLNLARDPLANFTLLKLNEYEHVLVCAIHHLIFDGISFRIFSEELWRLYAESMEERVSALSNIPPQYSDYALRQRAEHGKWLGEHGPYWRSSLTGASCVQLPYDEGLENVERFSGAILTTSIGARLSSAVKALARSEQVTAATVMLVGYLLLLSSWTGKTDLVIPFVVPGRHGTMQMKIIGLMGEYLPLRLQLKDDELIVALLKRASDELMASCKHLDFGKIISESPGFFRGTSLNWFPNYVDSLVAPAAWSGRKDCPTIDLFHAKSLEPLDNYRKLTCDMGCMLADTNEGIVGTVIYRADLFEQATIERFFEDLKTTLERIVQDPWSDVSSLRIKNQA